MSGFNDIVQMMTQESEGYRAAIPEGWRQGRTAYGGGDSGAVISRCTKPVSGPTALSQRDHKFYWPRDGRPCLYIALVTPRP